MARPTLRARGLREAIRAFDRAGRQAKREFRSALRVVGHVVRDEWADRFDRIDPRSAAGLRTVVRQRGVSVEQTIRRTTGLRPDYGAKQMRFGIGVLADKEHEIEVAAEEALDRVVDHFGR